MSLVKNYPAMREKGARYITLIYQDTSRQPATMSSVDAWIQNFKCNYDVVLAPQGARQIIAATGGTVGLPYHVIVNPRDMKIHAIVSGSGPALMTKMNEVIAKNTP